MTPNPILAVEGNLRQSFRALAHGRPRADIIEMQGLTIASLGVAFQMFNAAFLNSPVASQHELELRLYAAQSHFLSRSAAPGGMPWSFWFCEDLLDRSVRRKLSNTCRNFGVRLSSEMPGMLAESLDRPSRILPRLEIRRVSAEQTLNDFRAIGSSCFHVPVTWFSEVFEPCVLERDDFVCWIGYHDGVPVATAATVISENSVIGVYNVATAREHRSRGYGEAITRYAIEAAARSTGISRVVLQSTGSGLRLYERMGFRAVTRVLVYNSGR